MSTSAQDMMDPILFGNLLEQGLKNRSVFITELCAHETKELQYQCPLLKGCRRFFCREYYLIMSYVHIMRDHMSQETLNLLNVLNCGKCNSVARHPMANGLWHLQKHFHH